MNKYSFFTLSWLLAMSTCLLTFSCSDSVEDETTDGNVADQVIAFDEENLKEYVHSKLKLNPEDIGSFEMKRAHLNADGQEDGYIFVNLAPKAKRDMENSSNPARFHDAGYIGDYNYLFVWDGATQKMGTPFKLVGNGLIPLEVSLINLLDPGFKTIKAQYRVQNSVFQTYFLNVGGSLIPVFSYLIVDQLGTEEMKVYVHKLEENPSQLEMDIVIYEGQWTDYEKEKAAIAKNDYPIGTISSTGKEIYRFFFDPRSGKYATNSPMPTVED
jgi:hypothetical protein